MQETAYINNIYIYLQKSYDDYSESHRKMVPESTNLDFTLEMGCNMLFNRDVLL